MNTNEGVLALPARGETIAASLVSRLAEAEAEADRAAVYPAASMRAVIDAGLLALNVPASAGGLGEDLGGTLESLRTLAHGSPSVALMLAMHTSNLAHYLIAASDVPADQRQAFLAQRDWAWREALDGRFFGVANSETGASGNVKNSRAELNDGLLFGVKSFCSGGTNADYYAAAARDEAGRVEAWLIANDGDHVSVATPWNAVGMRSSESVSLRFEGARVIGPHAYRGLLDGVNKRHWSTLSFTAVFVGVAESLLEDATRTKGGVLPRTEAVELHLAVEASRAFLRHCVAAEPAVADGPYRRLVRDCKTFVTRTLARHASDVLLAAGGSAYRFESSISRKARDLMAGPAVRPPVAVTFDEIWEELSAPSA